MERALVIGASGGIGCALVQELQRKGYHVTTLSRSADQFDITDETSIAAAMERLSGPFDLRIPG